MLMNGQVRKSKFSVIFTKSSNSAIIGSLGIEIPKLRLVKLIKYTTGDEISKVPVFGTLVIPELTYITSTGDISGAVLSQLVVQGSPFERFKKGIAKGIAADFIAQIGKFSGITARFASNKLHFEVKKSATLTVNALLSLIPRVKKLVSILPSNLVGILQAKITSFSFDPNSKQLQLRGELQEQASIIPKLLSLTSATASLDVLLAPNILVKSLEMSGVWVIKKLAILTTVSYNFQNRKLSIRGKPGNVDGGVNIIDFMASLSGITLPIPPAVTSTTLINLAGSKVGKNIMLTVTGRAGKGDIFVIYQHSPAGSAVAFAADVPQFKLSSLVSSTTKNDISSLPFFGTLVVPRLGFTIASKEIISPRLATLFPPHSPLRSFGVSIPKGVNAVFIMRLASASGVIAKYSNAEMELKIPKTAYLYMANVAQLIPGIHNLVNSLPKVLRNIAKGKAQSISISTATAKVRVSGVLNKVKIVPDFLVLHKVAFSFSGVIGTKTKIHFVRFKGDWSLSALKFSTEVIYDKVLILEGYPSGKKYLNINTYIKELSGVDLKIPPTLSKLMISPRIVGKIGKGTTSLLLLAQTNKNIRTGIVYQKAKSVKVVAFAADVPKFKLVDLVKAGTGVDISSIPFFGKYTIPMLSLVISSKQFSTALLPDLKIPGVPKELFLENIPQGVKGQFVAAIGKVSGLKVEYSRNIISIIVPSSATLSLHDLVSAIPNIKPAINALPSTLRNILSARVQSLVFEPVSKKLKVTLSTNTLTLVPNIITLNKLEVFLQLFFKPKIVVQSSQMVHSVNMQINVEQDYASRFGLHISPLTSPLQETANAQVVNVEVLRMKGEWAIQGLRLVTKANYKTHTKELHIEGVSNSVKANSISVSDLIKGLSGAGLSVPSVISSLKVKKVTGSSKDGSVTIILSASSATSDVYLVFQKFKTSTAVGLAAEIKDFKLSKLIKLATGIDISSVPFLGPFKIDSLAYSVSTKDILSPLLSTTYDSDSPLQHYGNKLPRGLTSHFVAEIGGKQGIQITYAQKMLEFRVPKGKELSLQGLLSEIPDVSATMKTLPSPLSDLLSSKVVVFHFHSSTKQISIAAKLDFLTLIPRVMKLRNLQLSLKMDLGSRKGITFLMFSADWMLQGVSITTKVSYYRPSNSILFSATPKRNGQMNIQQLIKGLSGMNMPIPSIINSALLTRIIGRKTADVFTFIFSSSVPGKANVHLIYRNSGVASTLAIAALIKSYKLSELVKSAVKVDVTSVPFFGMFSVPSMAIVISKDDLTIPLLSKVFASKFLHSKYGTKLPKGFSARFDAAIGRAKGVIGSYANKVISFIVPQRMNVPLTSLFSVIDIKSLALPPVFGDIFRLRVKKFIFDIQKHQAIAELFLSKITILKNALSIKNTHLRLTAKFSTPKSFSAEAKGVITLGRRDYGAIIRRDSKINKYVLSVRTQKLPIFGIITQFGAAFLPSNLKKVFGKVFNVYILDVRIVYPFGAKPQQTMISGIPHIFGLKTAHMTSVVMQYQQDMIMILKIKFGKINIADTIKKTCWSFSSQDINFEPKCEP